MHLPFLKLKRTPSLLLICFFGIALMSVACTDEDEDPPTPKQQNDTTSSYDYEPPENEGFDFTIQGDLDMRYKDDSIVSLPQPWLDSDGYQASRDAYFGIGMLQVNTAKANGPTLYMDIFKKDTAQIQAGTYPLTLQKYRDSLLTGCQITMETANDQGYMLLPQPGLGDAFPYQGEVAITAYTDTSVKGYLKQVSMHKFRDTSKSLVINGAFHLKR